MSVVRISKRRKSQKVAIQNYSKLLSTRSVADAKSSVKNLSKLWTKSDIPEKRRMIYSVNQTRGRVKTQYRYTKNEVRRQELKGIYGVYKNWSDNHTLSKSNTR